MVMARNDDERLSDALLHALENALQAPTAQGHRAEAAGPVTARRAQVGETVLRTLSAWLAREADPRGTPGVQRAELRRTLAELLDDNLHDTQPGRRLPDARAAPRARHAQVPESPQAASEPTTGPSPRLAQKLAAKLAAVAAAKASPGPATTPMDENAPDPAAGQAEAPSTPRTRPTAVGERYELITRIHQGAHTSVWRGIDTQARSGETAVAIKLIAGAYAEALDETTLATLREVSAHPGLMSLGAAGHQDGWVYQVGEWLDGQTLETLLRSRAEASFGVKLPAWMRQLADALEALHQAGLVHGDLKPANVMISHDDTARLIDFDTVCPAGSTGAWRSLTPAFASPERRAGEPADVRDDVFSMAVIVYQLFTGELPHGDETRRTDGPSPPAPSRPERLDTRQWQALRRALAGARAQRTASVRELVNELWDAERSNVPATVQREQPASTPRRPSGRWALAGAGLAALAVVGVLVYPQLPGSADQPSVLERLWPQADSVAPRPTDQAASATEPLPVNPSSASDGWLADAPRIDPLRGPALGVIEPPGMAESAEPIDPIRPEDAAIDGSASPSQVSFTQTRMQVPWNAPAALVALRRTGSLAEPSTVEFDIEPGLAEPDEDFVAPDEGRVEFDADEDTALIIIPLVQRTAARGTRSLWVTLSGDSVDPDGINEIQVVLMNDL